MKLKCLVAASIAATRVWTLRFRSLEIAQPIDEEEEDADPPDGGSSFERVTAWCVWRSRCRA